MQNGADSFAELTAFINRPTDDMLLLYHSSERDSGRNLSKPDFLKFSLDDRTPDEVEIYLDILQARIDKVLWAVTCAEGRDLDTNLVANMTPFERGVALWLTTEIREERERVKQQARQSPAWRRLNLGGGSDARGAGE